MLLHKLENQSLIHPPKWLSDNTCLLTVMGSNAYGVSSDNSDLDVYGFCVPPKNIVFPHLGGVVNGFDTQVHKNFDQWSEHHIKFNETEYDFAVYSIVKYFRLCMDNNPNMIDSLFTSRRCVIHSTQIGELVRENRKLFLHKGAWNKFKGYAYSQIAKIRNKDKAQSPERNSSILEYGYDLKFAYHLVRLMNEVEQILIEHDLDLERNREQLKSIRRGDWTLEQIETYFTDKERALETVYASSTLPAVPNEEKIKDLLLKCLEIHYGSLSAAVTRVQTMDLFLRDLKEVIEKYDSK